MRITKDYLNKKYKEYLKYSITGGKDRFGWYSATLKNGKVAVGSNYEELEQSILSRI